MELQILKHLKRDAQPTVAIIDQYCEDYKELFPEVKRLNIEAISDHTYGE